MRTTLQNAALMFTDVNNGHTMTTLQNEALMFTDGNNGHTMKQLIAENPQQLPLPHARAVLDCNDQ